MTDQNIFTFDHLPQIERIKDTRDQSVYPAGFL
jgi:hypothetical protein